MQKMMLCGIILLVATCSSFAGLRLSADLGGTTSNLGYKYRKEITVDNSTMVTALNAGVGIEAVVKEMFGLRTGIYYEEKGASIHGTLSILAGKYDYRYKYLQIPCHAEIIIPLLIPGSIFVSAGPEFGINLERTCDFQFDNSTASFKDTTFERRSSTWDFGISGKGGYELPIGRFMSLLVYGGYYYGLIDLYENKDDTANDFDLFNRTIRYGITLSVNIVEF